jgi:signal peptide peptidase SppA
VNYLSSLITTPWSIREEWLPVLATTIARIASGQPIAPADRARIDSRRAEFLAAHPQAARGDEPFVRVRAEDAGGRGIAVIGIYGVMTQRGGIDVDTSEPLLSTTRVMHAVQIAAADPTIAAILLDVDSPGGSVYGIAELGDAIYAARDAKPTVAIANSLAASASYWAASQAGELYAAAGGEVGSIGVYTLHADISEALSKAGISMTQISAGRYKTEGSRFAPLGADARDNIQATINQYYDAFVRAVARGRGESQKFVRESMGEGRTLLPGDAKAQRMIDGVATLDGLVAKLQTRMKRGSAMAYELGTPGATAELARMRESLNSPPTAAPRSAATMQRELDVILAEWGRT